MRTRDWPRRRREIAAAMDAAAAAAADLGASAEDAAAALDRFRRTAAAQTVAIMVRRTLPAPPRRKCARLLEGVSLVALASRLAAPEFAEPPQ